MPPISRAGLPPRPKPISRCRSGCVAAGQWPDALTMIRPRTERRREYHRVKGALQKVAQASLVTALVLAAGCRPAGPLARVGITVSPPASWRQVEPSPGKVAGVPLAAWTGPDGASLVLYRSLPAPGGSAKMIGEALANRLANLPGLTIVVHRTEPVGQVTAARVEVVAPGTGNALAPSGTGTPIGPAASRSCPLAR